MLYRASMLAVLCPEISIAVRSSHPESIRLATPVRRKSCSVFPARPGVMPTARQADLKLRRKLTIRLPRQWKA